MTLPDHPVRIGDSWNMPMDIDVVHTDGSTKKIETRQKFTLAKVSDDVATIDVDTQILTPIHDPSIEAQLIQRLSTGTVRFDIAAGRVLGQQLDLDRRVIGFSGPATSMHYLTRFSERILTAEVPVAKKRPASADAANGSAKAPANGKAAARRSVLSCNFVAIQERAAKDESALAAVDTWCPGYGFPMKRTSNSGH